MGGSDGTTKLWDKDGKSITTLNSNRDAVLSVAFSPDGSRIATGGDDGTTKIWDKDGNQVGQFEGGSPAFSSDWQTIALATRPSYFGAPLTDSEASIVQLYRIDLNLAIPPAPRLPTPQALHSHRPQADPRAGTVRTAFRRKLERSARLKVTF